MIFNKVLEAELEQCLVEDFVPRDAGMKDGCKGTKQFNLDEGPGRLIGREWRVVLHEYKRGRRALGSSFAAPPPRLPCTPCSTLWIPRRSSDDFCI